MNDHSKIGPTSQRATLFIPYRQAWKELDFSGSRLPLTASLPYPGEILMTTERDKCISCRYLHQPTAREKHHGRCNGSQAADTLQKPSFLSVNMERCRSCQSSFFCTDRAAEICLGPAPKCRKMMAKVGERGGNGGFFAERPRWRVSLAYATWDHSVFFACSTWQEQESLIFSRFVCVRLLPTPSTIQLVSLYFCR